MARRGTELETRFTGDDADFQKVKTRVVKGAGSIGTAYEKAGKRAQKSISGIGSKLSSLKGIAAGVAGAGLVSGALGMAERRQVEAEGVATEIDKMLKQSERLGIDFETFQRQVNVFQKAGLEADNYFNVLSKLTRKAEEARDKGGEMADSFDALNIDLERFTQLRPEEQMRRLADAYRDAGNQNQAFRHVAKIVEDDAKQLRDILAPGGAVMRAQEGAMQADELVLLRDAQQAARLKDEQLRTQNIKRANMTKDGFDNLMRKTSQERNLETGLFHRLNNLLMRGTTNDRADPDTFLRQSDLDEMKKDTKRTADAVEIIAGEVK